MGKMMRCPHCGFEFQDVLTCKRCGHSWKPRGDELPTVCPNPHCKSPYWNKPRMKRIKPKEKVGK